MDWHSVRTDHLKWLDICLSPPRSGCICWCYSPCIIRWWFMSNVYVIVVIVCVCVCILSWCWMWFLFPIGSIGEFHYLHICRPLMLVDQKWWCHTFPERSEWDLFAFLVPRDDIPMYFAIRCTCTHSIARESMSCPLYGCIISLSLHLCASSFPLDWVCVLPVSATSAWIPYNHRIVYSNGFGYPVWCLSMW